MQAEDVTKVVDREQELSDEVALSNDLPRAETSVLDPEREHEPSRPSASASDTNIADVEPGQTLLGRYELIHRLGHGGMASVHLGRAIGTAGFERLVAVKVIHPHLASEPEFVEMFLDEARIAAKIHHPHVCETIDLGEDEGLFFMVMEYVEGDTLSSLTRQLTKAEERLSVLVALQIASDACRGLAAAHDLADNQGEPLDLVHRDVSPHNLLVSMDGRVKVVDFGIMKAAGKRSCTRTGQLRGKLTYMSPEQARGEPVDRRSDLYAVGVILWELLAGTRFYRGQTESEVLAQVSLGRTRDIREFRDDLSDSVLALLTKVLSTSRADRYDTAQAMLKDLRAARRELIDADADDPREELGATMKRFFGGRIEYVRAAIRGGAEERELSGRRPAARAANDSKVNVIASRSSMTPSNAVIGSTGTMTTTPAPARSWALWLVLPLAGAAIGTAAVSGGFAKDAPPAIEEPTVKNEVPEPAPAPELVKWWINTDPQGATIFIDGEPLPDPTPTAVQLPRGDETVLVRLELDGYKARQLRMAPLRPENHTLPLEPAYKTTFAVRPRGEEDEVAPQTPRKRPSGHSPRKAKKQPAAKPPSDTKPSTAEDASKPGDGRQPEDVPDFLRGTKRP